MAPVTTRAKFGVGRLEYIPGLCLYAKFCHNRFILLHTLRW